MKRQFSKTNVVIANTMVFYVYTVTAILAYLGKEPLSDLALGIISIYGTFAMGGYYLLNGFRDVASIKMGSIIAESTKTEKG